MRRCWCKTCRKSYSRLYYQKNAVRERKAAVIRMAARRKRNPDLIKAQKSAHYFRHKVQILEKNRDYYSTHRSQVLSICREWRSKNRGKIRFYSRTKQAKKLKRVPQWANLNEIRKFYMNRPYGYHVDHIIPLCGKTVSGLHVLSNLQYLPIKENLRKSNKV